MYPLRFFKQGNILNKQSCKMEQDRKVNEKTALSINQTRTHLKRKKEYAKQLSQVEIDVVSVLNTNNRTRYYEVRFYVCL